MTHHCQHMSFITGNLLRLVMFRIFQFADEVIKCMFMFFMSRQRKDIGH